MFRDFCFNCLFLKRIVINNIGKVVIMILIKEINNVVGDILNILI